MATSKYLNVYDPGQNIVNQGTIFERVEPNAKGAGQVVHDMKNNKYYGDQSLDTMIKGMENYISQLTKQIEQGGKFGTQNAGTMYETSVFQKFDDQLIADTQSQIEQTRNYMDQFNTRYEQSDKFFDSYDAYTQDWDNVFSKRKSNAVTLRRNDMISEENAARANKAKEQDTKVATGSVAKSKKLTPNLEINTGISAAADKLVQSLNKTGLGI